MIKKNKTFIIAEIGNNHEGSFKIAKKLIVLAAKSGVDAVKFQTFKVEDFVNNTETKKIKKLKKFQLSENEFIKLAKIARENKLKFISTPLDIRSAIFLNKIVDGFKISSGDNNYFELIKKVLSFKKYTIISLGLLNFKEIKKLVSFIKKQKFPMSKLSLLHCVSAYPVKESEANLKSILYLKKNFDISIGYSDHTIGNYASFAATCLGADILEKHFTLNHNYSSFRDHQLSANPKEMKELVFSIRKIQNMMGKFEKKISETEKKNIKSLRRSIFAKEDIFKNQIITEKNVKIVRPQNGIEPKFINKIIGKKSKKKIFENNIIIKKLLI